MTTEAAKPQGMATASMVLGIVGAVLSITPCTFFLGILCDVLAVVLGYFALQKVKSGEAGGETFAKVGLWTGGIGCILFFLAWAAVGSALKEAEDDFNRNMDNLQREMDRLR